MPRDDPAPESSMQSLFSREPEGFGAIAAVQRHPGRTAATILLAAVLAATAALAGATAALTAALLLLPAVTAVAVLSGSRPPEPSGLPATEVGTRLLLLLTDSLEEPRHLEAIEEMVGRERRSATEALVLAPVPVSRHAPWLSDSGEARMEAQRRLVLAIAGLATIGIEAQGRVGDADPVRAAEDALRSFSADAVLVVPGTDAEGRRTASRLRRRLERSVHRLGSEARGGRASHPAPR